MVGILILSLINAFNLKWYLPIGCAVGVSGRILVADTDRNGCYELYISDYQLPDYIYVCELHLPNTWEIDSFTNTGEQLAFDIGDFDNDGLYDILQCGCATPGIPPFIMFVNEASDSFSYPVNEVWRDTVGLPLVAVSKVYDMDGDSLPEIVKCIGDPYGDIVIYEATANNIYNMIFSDTASYDDPYDIAFGDFDQDAYNEAVFAGDHGTYWIYECPANNTYERLCFNALPTHNIRDCFKVPDMDGDGKWEFVIKGFWVYGGIDAFIFEATGNNTYDTVKVFHFLGGDYHGGHSDAGDVDGDSIPEIVLEARQNVFIIKAAGNDSFYVWETLPGNTAGFNIKIFDLDNNGLNEIILSGAQQTWIYEYSPEGVEEADKREVRSGKLEVFPNPFNGNLTVKFQSATILGGPNNKRLLNQPHWIPACAGMTRQSPGPVALSKPEGLPYIRIFDIAGRLVKSFSLPTSNFLLPTSVEWNGTDDLGRAVPSGVYFVRLAIGPVGASGTAGEAEGEEVIRKAVLLR